METANYVVHLSPGGSHVLQYSISHSSTVSTATAIAAITAITADMPTSGGENWFDVGSNETCVVEMVEMVEVTVTLSPSGGECHHDLSVAGHQWGECHHDLSVAGYQWGDVIMIYQ